MALPRSVRRYVALNVIAGVATLTLAGVLGAHRGFGRVWLFAAFTAVMTVAELFPVFLLHHDETEGLHFEESLIAAMAFLLPPFPSIIVLVVGAGIGQTVQRLPAVKRLFNLGQLVTSTGLAFAAMAAIGLNAPLGPRKVLAVVVGAAVFLFVNRLLVNGVIALMEQRPVWREFVTGFGLTATMWPGTVSSGVMAGLVGAWHLWMLPFALVATAALHATYSRQFGARRDRERVTGLLRTATSAHESVAVESVTAAVIEATRSLLLARRARIHARPPEDGELGSRLPLGGDELWLVVTECRGKQGFDAADARLLDAVAAIAASALRNASLFEELERTNAERRRLFAHIVTTREEERRKIAEDIHDDSVQVMAAAAMQLSVLERELAEPAQRARLTTVEETVRLAIARLRSLIFELRPPVLDLEGLAPAIRTYLERRAPEGLRFSVVNDLAIEPEGEIRTTAYRIAQEALSNACRHAGATRVEVRVGRGWGVIHVVVTDDGRGFSPKTTATEPGHLGLSAMRERAEVAGGWLTVESQPGTGTVVEFWIPAARTPAGRDAFAMYEKALRAEP